LNRRPRVRPLSVVRWGLVAILVVLLGYLTVLRPWHLRWGATHEEVSRAMPGDDLIPDPGLNTTRAITIRATPDEIWPWLVQMGYGRAGWYSYDRLDNGGRPSADRIVPALQVPLKSGQPLPGGPEKGFKVISVEPNRSLVLGPSISWSLGLYPQPDGTTRLVERLRAKYWWNRPRTYPMIAALDVGDFIMMRRQLLNLKQRIEANVRVNPS
jgi:hypothetical protein